MVAMIVREISPADCDCPTLSDGRWTSQSCSIPSTTLLQPLGYNLTLLPSPIDYNTFSLTIHWDEIGNIETIYSTVHVV